MTYNQKLAQRIREEIKTLPDLQEKKMFGGVGFLIQGNMACGVHGEDLIVRTGPENYQAALSKPHTKPFNMTGKPMSGWIEVDSKGFEAESDLKDWVQLGVKFAKSLPPK
jgi:TfoX/Sxy family transcriptional regulator of competence genes